MGFPLSTHEQAYKSLWVDERESFKYFCHLQGWTRVFAVFVPGVMQSPWTYIG